MATPYRLSERTGSSSIYSYLGLDKIINIASSSIDIDFHLSIPNHRQESQSEFRMTLTELHSFIEKLISPSICLDSLAQYPTVVCFMDRGNCRNLQKFTDSRKRLGAPLNSTILRKSLSASPAPRYCDLELPELNKEVLLIHVRRGDIAIADLNSLSREGLVDHSPEDDQKPI